MKDFHFTRYLILWWDFIICNQKAIASLEGNINLLERQCSKSWRCLCHSTVALLTVKLKANLCKLRHNHQSRSRSQVPALCLCSSVRVCVHRSQFYEIRVIFAELNLIKYLHVNLSCFDSSQNYKEWESVLPSQIMKQFPFIKIRGSVYFVDPTLPNRKRGRYHTDCTGTENKFAGTNLRLYGGNTDSVLVVNIVAQLVFVIWCQNIEARLKDAEVTCVLQLSHEQ
jgi:hypothetical protein